MDAMSLSSGHLGLKIRQPSAIHIYMQLEAPALSLPCMTYRSTSNQGRVTDATLLDINNSQKTSCYAEKKKIRQHRHQIVKPIVR